VSHSHTVPELSLPGTPRFLNGVVKKIVAALYRNYDGLISPTEFLQEKFNDCHFKMKQTVIGNGVDTTIFYPGEKRVSDIFEILFVGRFDPEKNIPILFKALQLLREQKKLQDTIRCVCVG
jgi:glycosyltransferase involved in cell wall biosynthesis